MPVVAGVHAVRKLRTGREPVWYVYAVRGGPQIMRHEGWNRPKLGKGELKRLIDVQESEIKRIPSNTLGELAREWRPHNPEWMRLSVNTRRTWGNALDRIETKWGDTPLNLWNDPRMTGKVVSWRDARADTPRGADIGVTVLRVLLEFGRLRGRLAINVAKGIPQLYRGGNRAEIVWSDTDIAAFSKASEELDAQVVLDAVLLCSLTGLRRSDLVSLRWDELTDEAIVKKAAKVSRGRRRTVTIPRIPALCELLTVLAQRDRSAGVQTVLVNSRGKPWTVDGLSTSFSKVRDRADIAYVDPETGERRMKHLHDLRGTYCTKLILAGVTHQEAADVMGWSPEQVASIMRTYVDQGRVTVAIGRRLKDGL